MPAKRKSSKSKKKSPARKSPRAAAPKAQIKRPGQKAKATEEPKKRPLRAPKKRAGTPPRSKVQATRSKDDSSLWGRTAKTKEAATSVGLVRLNHYMAQCGVASRRASDEFISQGRVMINGEIVKELGTKIDPLRDRVVVDDRLLKPERATYVVLHKPAGVVCTNATREQKTRAIDLVSSVKGRLFPVGRLDVDSEGLLLLTNDGQFADRMTHPRYGVPKNYDIVVRGQIEYEKIDKIRGGVWLAEGRTQGARIRVKRRGAERSYLEVEIREGKNREVRRMFSRIGYPVLRLKRTRIGPVTIRGLGKGKYRFLTKSEIDGLLHAASEEGGFETPTETEKPRSRQGRSRASGGRTSGAGRAKRR